MKELLMSCIVTIFFLVFVSPAMAVDPQVFQDGANRLTATQNTDGGWDWPLDDGDPGAGSAQNTIGPIGMGLAQAYYSTEDPDHLAALESLGTFLLAKINTFSAQDAYMAAELDNIFGGTAYVDHMKTYFYDQLAAGTYDLKGLGVTYTTQEYIDYVRQRRADQGIANLAAWDMGMALVGVVAAGGIDPSPWISATEAEVAEIVFPGDYDVIGLAGAVYGLSCVPNPTVDLLTLADQLAGYQIDGNGFAEVSSNLVAGGESIQETAYALIALNRADREQYIAQITGASQWLEAMQLPTGGWGGDSGGTDGENNEVTGEALWALQESQRSIPVGPCFISTVADSSTMAFSMKLVIVILLSSFLVGLAGIAIRVSE